MTGFDTDIDLPQGVEATLQGVLLLLKGPKGSSKKRLYHPTIAIQLQGKKILITSKAKKPNKNHKMLINSFRAHIKNMILGVQKPYRATLKVCSGHFPITVMVEGNMVVIKNFLGEKSSRKTGIMEGVKVTVQGDQIIVEGVDLENVAQTAARIEQSTRITNRDRRIFQDGCYITLKAGEEK